MSSSLVVSKNNQINEGKTLPIWGPEFEIKFDLKINSWISDWGSIFRFSALTGNRGTIGQRVPALWTRKGTKNKMHLVTNIGSNANKVFANELGRFKKRVWYSFVISQKKHPVRNYL